MEELNSELLTDIISRSKFLAGYEKRTGCVEPPRGGLRGALLRAFHCAPPAQAPGAPREQSPDEGPETPDFKRSIKLLDLREREAAQALDAARWHSALERLGDLENGARAECWHELAEKIDKSDPKMINCITKVERDEQDAAALNITLSGLALNPSGKKGKDLEKGDLIALWRPCGAAGAAPSGAAGAAPSGAAAAAWRPQRRAQRRRGGRAH